MTLDYSTKGKVIITMYDYIIKMLAEVPDEWGGQTVTPATDNMFKINDNPVFLPAEQKELFHHFVAMCLFLCKRARPDIHPSISFLTTRVQHPDEDDWKKLGRCIKYLRHTQKMVLTLGDNGSNKITMGVDAAFAVHPDIKNHTGGNFSMGEGTMTLTFKKQKLNTRSSTKSELVGQVIACQQHSGPDHFSKPKVTM